MSAKFQDNFLRAVVSFENRKIQLGVVSVYNQLTQKDIESGDRISKSRGAKRTIGRCERGESPW